MSDVTPTEPTTSTGLTQADLDAYAAQLAQERAQLDAYRGKLAKAAKQLKATARQATSQSSAPAATVPTKVVVPRPAAEPVAKPTPNPQTATKSS